MESFACFITVLMLIQLIMWTVLGSFGDGGLKFRWVNFFLNTALYIGTFFTTIRYFSGPALESTHGCYSITCSLVSHPNASNFLCWTDMLTACIL
jgi:hypothetical protein